MPNFTIWYFFKKEKKKKKKGRKIPWKLKLHHLLGLKTVLVYFEKF